MDTSFINSYILVNPSFLSPNEKKFTLVCSEPTIGNSIKYFWNELARHGFSVKNDKSLISNFPMYIYDKREQMLRQFTINQYLQNNISKLRYDEVAPGLALSDLTGQIGFDEYFNRLNNNTFTIELDISRLATDNKSIRFPRFNRSLFLKY